MSFVSFLKSSLFYILCYCFCMYDEKNILYILEVHNLKSKCCYDAKLLAYYFYMKTKISADFQICISVPLRVQSCKLKMHR